MTNRLLTGSYTGNSGVQTIVLGVQPSVLMIFRAKKSNGDVTYKTVEMSGEGCFEMTAAVEYITVDGVTIVSNGFSLANNPASNKSNETYYYVAWC